MPRIMDNPRWGGKVNTVFVNRGEKDERSILWIDGFAAMEERHANEFAE